MKYTKATAETIEFNSSDVLAGINTNVSVTACAFNFGWHVGVSDTIGETGVVVEPSNQDGVSVSVFDSNCPQMWS